MEPRGGRVKTPQKEAVLERVPGAYSEWAKNPKTTHEKDLKMTSVMGEANFSGRASAASAVEPLNRPHQVFLSWVCINRSSQNGFVPSEALSEPDVFALPIDVGAGSMSQGMKVKEMFNACSSLPDLEGVAELARRESVAVAADEEGGVIAEALSLPSLELVELIELGAQPLVEEHFLRLPVAGALEDAEEHAGPGALAHEDVAHVEGQQLMLTQACPKSHREEDVVSKAAHVLSGGLEQQTCLSLSQSAWGLSDVVGVAGHAPPLGRGEGIQASKWPGSKAKRTFGRDAC